MGLYCDSVFSSIRLLLYRAQIPGQSRRSHAPSNSSWLSHHHHRRHRHLLLQAPSAVADVGPPHAPVSPGQCAGPRGRQRPGSGPVSHRSPPGPPDPLWGQLHHHSAPASGPPVPPESGPGGRGQQHLRRRDRETSGVHAQSHQLQGEAIAYGISHKQQS